MDEERKDLVDFVRAPKPLTIVFFHELKSRNEKEYTRMCKIAEKIIPVKYEDENEKKVKITSFERVAYINKGSLYCIRIKANGNQFLDITAEVTAGDDPSIIIKAGPIPVDEGQSMSV